MGSSLPPEFQRGNDLDHKMKEIMTRILSVGATPDVTNPMVPIFHSEMLL